MKKTAIALSAAPSSKPTSAESEKLTTIVDGHLRFTRAGYKILTSVFQKGTKAKDAKVPGNLAAVILFQVSECLPFGNANDSTKTREVNFALQAMRSLKPRDGLEALICAQLVATHSLGMEFLRLAAFRDQISEGTTINVNRATRLLGTFAQLAQTLRAHRSGGEQKMIVRHVHVNAGAQAVIGSVRVRSGGSGDAKKKRG